MHLIDLPYTSKKITPAKYFKTAPEGLRLLTKKSAITTAADNGVINVWYGEDGLWHGIICRYMAHIAEFEGKPKSGLRDWLQRALIRIS